jgi:hypothetical protein
MNELTLTMNAVFSFAALLLVYEGIPDYLETRRARVKATAAAIERDQKQCGAHNVHRLPAVSCRNAA